MHLYNLFTLFSMLKVLRGEWLTSPNPSSLQYFGNALAATNDHVLVGTQTVDEHASAYIYEVSNLANSSAVLPLGPKQFTRFGEAVAIATLESIGKAVEDELFIVGAPIGGPKHDGQVYVYWDTDMELTNSSVPAEKWATQQMITASDKAPYSSFGNAVAACGSLLIIGAEKDAAMGIDNGAVYLYAWDKLAKKYVDEQKLLPSPETVGEGMFGHAVSCSALDINKTTKASYHLLAISAFGDSRYYPAQGAVYLYPIYTSTGHPPHRQVHSVGEAVVIVPTTHMSNYGHFGTAVAQYKQSLAVSAMEADRSGAVYFYPSAYSAPNLYVRLVPKGIQPESRFGYALLNQYPYLVAGAPGALTQDTAAKEKGAVYLFYVAEENKKVFIHECGRHQPNITELINSAYGSSLALVGNHLLVGAPLASIDSAGTRSGAVLLEPNALTACADAVGQTDDWAWTVNSAGSQDSSLHLSQVEQALIATCLLLFLPAISIGTFIVCRVYHRQRNGDYSHTKVPQEETAAVEIGLHTSNPLMEETAVSTSSNKPVVVNV